MRVARCSRALPAAHDWGMSNHQSTFKEHEHPRAGNGEFVRKIQSESPVTLSVPSYSDPTYDLDDHMVWEDESNEYGPVYTNKVGGIELSLSRDIRGEGEWTARAVDFRGNRPKTLRGSHEPFDNIDDAKKHVKAIRAEALRFGVNDLAEGSKSPWGSIQDITNIAPGIDAVGTAGHGGVKLSGGRQGKIHPAWRKPRGWYEEDLDAGIVCITFPEEFEPRIVERAHRALRNHYPDEYEKAVKPNPARFGLSEYKPITVEESDTLAEQQYYAARAETHVRFVTLDREPEGKPGMIAFELDDLPADGKNIHLALNRRTVLVPEEKWNDVAGHIERGTFPKGIIE